MSTRANRWVRRIGVVTLTASSVLIGGIGSLTAANADQPVKVGWWNAAAGGGHSAPADTSPGGLRVSVSGSKVLAFGAVAYNLSTDGTATLELSVTNQSPEPSQAPANPASLPDTNTIVACPTTDNSWSAGDDQDAANAPNYDCSSHHFVGALSSDGKTMTFFVDGAADITPGTLSLAILPDTTTAIYELGTDAPSDVTPPYFINFDKPAATSFTITSGSSGSTASTSTVAPPPPPPPVTTSSGSTVAPPTSTTPSLTVPSSTGTVAPPAQTPVVAGNGQQQQATAPVAATKSSNSTEKNNLAWGLLLLLFAAVIVTSMNRQRAPRIIAGPGVTPTATTDTAPPDVAAAAAAAAAAGNPAAPAWFASMFAPRGLGRFAKPRTTAARPLV
jgi:hypothetical protein